MCQDLQKKQRAKFKAASYKGYTQRMPHSSSVIEHMHLKLEIRGSKS